MKKVSLMSVLFILFLFQMTIQASADCLLPHPSAWEEITDSANRLVINVTNDRNLYFQYVISGTGVELSHKVYACGGKELYFDTYDGTAEIFAYLQPFDDGWMRIHFADKDGNVKTTLDFKRLASHP